MKKGVVTPAEMTSLVLLVAIGLVGVFILAGYFDAQDDVVGGLFSSLTFLFMRIGWMRLKLNNPMPQSMRMAIVVVVLVIVFVMLRVASPLTGGFTDNIIGGYFAGGLAFLLERTWEYFQETPDPNEEDIESLE